MYGRLVENYQQVMSRFVGPTEVFVSGDTLQLKDYGKTDWPWTLFDPESKKLRHETVFPQHLRQAFEMGAAMGRWEEAGIIPGGRDYMGWRIRIGRRYFLHVLRPCRMMMPREAGVAGRPMRS